MKGLPVIFGGMAFLLCCFLMLAGGIDSNKEKVSTTVVTITPSLTDKPTGTVNLNAVFSPANKRDFFNKNQQFQSKCKAYGEKIKNGEDGFKLNKYPRYPIYDIGRDNRYDHKIYRRQDGTYEMRVNITCVYNVTVRLNLFAYGYETLEHDGGNVYFNMDIYQNKDTGRYHLAGMEAYKHSRN